MRRLLVLVAALVGAAPASAGAHGLSAERAQHRAERTAAEIARSLTLRSGAATSYNVALGSCVRAGTTGHRRDCSAVFDQSGRGVCSVRVRVRFRAADSFATVVYAVDRLRC